MKSRGKSSESFALRVGTRLVGSRDRLVPWIVPAIVLLVWQASASLGWLSTRLLPAPISVLTAARRLAVSGELFRAIEISSARAFVGLAIGGSIGLALGLANGLWAPAERVLDSSVQMLRNVPHLALIPLVIIWFGIEEQAKVFLVSLGVFFPIYLNTFHGVRTVDRGLIEMARVYGMSNWQLLTRVLLPGALPSILVGLRFALGTMWLTLIVAETIAAKGGIGYMAMNAREFMQTDVVLLAIVLYALLGKSADLLVIALERWLLSWHPAYQFQTSSRSQVAS
ncbi:MAG TPA: aliphatic sulfonate ABC transporter permease SsuC [Planctomycetaceae bacterium]|nr:aliphatic sulfonate ABC transporter permease SsuC [Planctomycetaceae bacterium]